MIIGLLWLPTPTLFVTEYMGILGVLADQAVSAQGKPNSHLSSEKAVKLHIIFVALHVILYACCFS